MAELWFVGLGLADERGLSERAWAALRGADEVYAEEYTAVAPEGTLERVAAALGRPVRRLDRALLESERPILEALGRAPRVALLVVGDPFAATTHVALRLAAERAGHAWRYVPAPSVLTAAAGFLGLMHYRFGRTVSLPFPEPGFAPRSPLEQVAGNRERGLHTLLLLDLRPADGRFLSADVALALLRERDPDGLVVPPGASVAVAARVGRDEAQGWFGPIEELARLDFGPPMHAIVVPAPELHFEEAAALERFRWRPKGPSP
ncbi:MAG: diphthine synthase [Thermoplasmata archaeon]